MRSRPRSSSGVRGKRCDQSLIGRAVPQPARRLHPLPCIPFSLFQKSHPGFRDPRCKSNSINQIIAQHAAGIPTSRLHANEAGRGCGKKVCERRKGNERRERGGGGRECRQRPMCSNHSLLPTGLLISVLTVPPCKGETSLLLIIPLLPLKCHLCSPQPPLPHLSPSINNANQ